MSLERMGTMWDPEEIAAVAGTQGATFKTVGFPGGMDGALWVGVSPKQRNVYSM
jgi:hypothetical protein